MNLLFYRKLLGVLAVIALLAGAFQIRRLAHDPAIVFLVRDGPAQWIRADVPFNPAKFDFDTTTTFETTVDAAWRANLEIAALRRVTVFIDGNLRFDSGPDLNQWKNVYLVPVWPGAHRLRFVVSNQRGPSLLRVNCPSLGVKSNADWKASLDGQSWAPAVAADHVADPHLPPQFASTAKDLLRLSPAWVGLFVVASVVCGLRNLRGSVVRWVMLIAWVVLAVNNIMKVPLPFGYDSDSHYSYIQYVADHLSLPGPDGGWQFFQSPLYYILSAGLERSLSLLGTSARTIPYLLRLIPLLCGGAMIEICFRNACLMFPDRSDLQAIAVMVGGFLPVNIYMSQAVSNESLAAVAGGLIALCSLRILKSGGHPALLGAAIGLALLTKINAILWILPAAIALLKSSRDFRSGLKSIAITLTIALAVSSGWFVRNLLMTGRPFFLESSVAHEQWWQDPGYRTPRMFYEFGNVFAHPVYNGTASVWDSLYGTLWANGIPTGQPPWNYGLMSCGLWLALLPTITVLVGIARAATGKFPYLWFYALVLACFIAAVLYVYLTLPIYSCAKASYLLSTAPCIGLLAAAGFDVAMINRWMRAVIGGAVICWGMVAYLTYFVIA